MDANSILQSYNKATGSSSTPQYKPTGKPKVDSILSSYYSASAKTKAKPTVTPAPKKVAATPIVKQAPQTGVQKALKTLGDVSQQAQNVVKTIGKGIELTFVKPKIISPVPEKTQPPAGQQQRLQAQPQIKPPVVIKPNQTKLNKDQLSTIIGPAQTQLIQGKKQTIWDKIGSFIGEQFDSTKSQQARAMNAMAVKKTHPEIKASLSQLSQKGGNIMKNSAMENVTKQLGIRKGGTASEAVSTVFTAAIALGLAEAPVSTAVGIGVFSAINEVKSGLISAIKGKGFKLGANQTLGDLFENAPPDVKNVLDIVDFLATAKATHSVFKASPRAFEILTKDTIEKYNMPKVVNLTPADIKKINLGKTGAEADLVKSLGLSSSAWRKAVKEGITIEVQSEKLTNIVDKPYWKKIKSMLGKEPTNIETKVTGGTTARPGFAGYLTDGQHTPQEVVGAVIKAGEENTVEGKATIKAALEAQNSGHNIEVKQVKESAPLSNLADEARKYKSAEEFVKAQGITVYHGTNSKVDVFDNRQRGGSTGAQSAKDAIWFTDSPSVAKDYAMHAAENGPIFKLQEQIDAAEKIAQRTRLKSDWKKYDDLIIKQEDLADYENTFNRRKSAIVNEAVVKGDFYTVDAKGKTPQELSSDANIDSWLTAQLDKAKRLGKDGVIFKNLDDTVNLSHAPTTHYAIFDPKKVMTKSQLQNFYNKAVGTTKPEQQIPQIEQAKNYTSAKDFATEVYSAQPNNQIGLVDPKTIEIRDNVDPKSPEYIKLKADIEKNGIKEPIRVTVADGKALTTDGSQRTAIARELGIKVPVIVNKGEIKGLRTIDEVYNKQTGADESLLTSDQAKEQEQKDTPKAQETRQKIEGIQEDIEMRRQENEAKKSILDQFEPTQIRAMRTIKRSINSRINKNMDTMSVAELPVYKDHIRDIMNSIGTDSEVEAVRYINEDLPDAIINATTREDLAKIKVLKSHLTPKEVQVPRDQVPVGEGKLKVSKLEARIKGVMKKATPEQIDELGLSTYNQMNKQEMIEKAAEYVANNQQEALEVIRGKKEPPKGIIPEAIYIALSEQAKGDVTLATKLASLQATALGQRISILSEIDKDSPVKLLNEVYKIREAEWKKRHGNRSPRQVKEKVVREIREKIKKPDKYDWNSFISSLEC